MTAVDMRCWSQCSTAETDRDLECALGLHRSGCGFARLPDVLILDRCGPGAAGRGLAAAFCARLRRNGDRRGASIARAMA